MNWIFIGIVVIFFAVVIINGAIDFLDKMPHTPLGAFFVIVAAIPAWIILKTFFMSPPDEEINRDWNFYAIILTIIIVVVLAGVVLVTIGAFIFG